MVKYTFLSLTLFLAFTRGKKIVSGDSERCRYETGSGLIDLNPLAFDDGTPRFKDVIDYQTEFAYSWNPCSSFNESTCVGAEVCQVDTAYPGYNVHMLGKPGESSFVQISDNVYFVYKSVSDTETVKRITNIKLVCDPSVDGELEVNGEDPLLTYNLTLTSRYACPKYLTTPRTTPRTHVTTAVPPTPGPNIFNLKTITYLLACILTSLCVLTFMVFLGLITRSSRYRGDNCSTGHINQAFQKKPIP